MKRLRYILTLVLSLLVIYSGVGVSVCSCLTCEVACMVCSTPCSECGQSDHHGSDAGNDNFAINCHDEGCSVSVYKVNLAQQSTQVSVSLPSFELFCGLLPDYQSLLSVSATEVEPYIVPPPQTGSRRLLAMYSVLVI